VVGDEGLGATCHALEKFECLHFGPCCAVLPSQHPHFSGYTLETTAVVSRNDIQIRTSWQSWCTLDDNKRSDECQQPIYVHYTRMTS
jgi:hypothetical protein